MPFILDKVDSDDIENRVARFRLRHSEFSLDVVFTRASFRGILSDMQYLGFTTQRIGYVLRLLNQKYPIRFDPVYRVPVPSDYSLRVLIEYLESIGYQVFRPLPFPDQEIISYLNERGFCVQSSLIHSSCRLSEN